MAVRDPRVLDRLNALNTNLENATNTDNIENNISGRLFNILEWQNSISIDSELYASINEIANASDITHYIEEIRNNLANLTAINIPYRDPATPINNTIIPAADPVDTGIAHMQEALRTLDALPWQIRTLRDRLEENHNILDDINNARSNLSNAGFERRNLTDIQNDINLCRELQGYLRAIDDEERYLRNHPGDADHEHRRDAALNAFNRNRTIINWIQELSNNVINFDAISNQVRDAQRSLNQENDLVSEIRRQESRLRNNRITVPEGFWLWFHDDDTRVTSPDERDDIGDLQNDINNRIQELNVLERSIEPLRTRYQSNLDNLNRITNLQQLQQRLNRTHTGEMGIRHNEFQVIQDIAYNNLLLWEDIAGRPRAGTYEPNLPNTSVTVLGPTATTVDLNFIHGNLARPWRFDYTLCNRDGTPLRINWGRFEYQLWTQTISLQWIRFTNNDVANQNMIIENLQINPVEGLTFPLVLELNVRVRIHDDETWLDIDHHKPIRLEITRPTLVENDRQNAYDSLMPPMNERITAEYGVDDTPSKYREELENEAIWSILREGWNEAEVNEIYNNETRRDMLINRIRTALLWGLPLLSLADLQVWFRTDMTRENRDVPVQYLLGVEQFQNYIRQSIPNNLREYASRTIRNNANNHRNDILQEFLNFQTDIANNRIDNNDNLRALYNIPPVEEWPEGHPNTFFQRLFWHDSMQNNYTKFFHWRHAELNDLSLKTEDWTVRYWVKVEVVGVNKIVATINIDWKEEPEIIDAPSHDDLIEWILARANTKDWEPLNRKLRCNMALAVLKAMVLMSPQRLTREIPPTDFIDDKWNTVNCDRMEAFVKWWNLRLRWGWIDWSRMRQNVTIFDEAQFKEIHDVEMLEDWIYGLSRQINMIMNATAQEYHEATSAMLRNDENRYVMRYNTAQRLRWWPIRRLWWRMVHGKTSNDFNFDTAVSEAWKSVNIKLDKWKFTVSGDFDGQHYEYKGRNLWSILRKRINRKRVFDGVELAMVAAINEAFIQKLRENHRVQTENFIVADMNDGKTWRTYVFDDAWNLSYLEIEDINLNPLWPGQSGRVDPDQVPAERVRCNEQERREFMQNPLLAGRLQREMRRRLALF